MTLFPWLFQAAIAAPLATDATSFVQQATDGDSEAAIAHCSPAFQTRERASCRELVHILAGSGVQLGPVHEGSDVGRVVLFLQSGGLPFALHLRAEKSEDGWRYTDGRDLDSPGLLELVPEVPYAHPALDAAFGEPFRQALLDGKPKQVCKAKARAICHHLGERLAAGAQLHLLSHADHGKRRLIVCQLRASEAPDQLVFLYVRRDRIQILDIDDDDDHAVRFLGRAPSR